LKKFKASLALTEDPTTGSNNQNGSPATPTPSKKQQKQQKQEQVKEKEQGKQQQQQKQQQAEEKKVDEAKKSPTQISVPIRPPPPPPTPPVKRGDEEVASSVELDKALHEWYSGQSDKSNLNDGPIRAKAEEINSQLYPDEKTRKQITNAWICSWKLKYAIIQPGTPVSPKIESRRGAGAGAGAEGDKDRDEDEEMKSEGDSVSSTASTPPPRAGESEEKRRRKEIKRLRKDIEKRDIQMAKAKIRKEASLRRIEELERENAAAR
jgi:hypothetical protein